MRLFIAAELPQELTDALGETSARLRDTVRGRYVGPDLFHVTLAFLGEVPSGYASVAAHAMCAACERHESFEATLGAYASFGRARSAVLWQGFSEGADSFVALSRDVRSELKSAGLTYDNKGFVPHVTLMRRADVSRGELPMPCVATGVVRDVTLFLSDLSGVRPRYDALEHVELR